MIANVDSSVRRFGRPLPVIMYAISEMLTSTKMGPTRNRYAKSAVSDWQTASKINTTNASRAAIDGSRQLNGLALLRFSAILESQLLDEIILKCGPTTLPEFGLLCTLSQCLVSRVIGN